jgi:hypothetical protein
MLDETYANGEGMDSFCSNHQTIPLKEFGTYAQPQCNIPDCLYIEENVIYNPGGTLINMCKLNLGAPAAYAFSFVCG